MKCPYCNEEVGQPKKYEVVNCKCRRKLMLIEINKVKELVDVTLEEDRSND